MHAGILALEHSPNQTFLWQEQDLFSRGHWELALVACGFLHSNHIWGGGGCGEHQSTTAPSQGPSLSLSYGGRRGRNRKATFIVRGCPSPPAPGSSCPQKVALALENEGRGSTQREPCQPELMARTQDTCRWKPTAFTDRRCCLSPGDSVHCTFLGLPGRVRGSLAGVHMGHEQLPFSPWNKHKISTRSNSATEHNLPWLHRVQCRTPMFCVCVACVYFQIK
jgi:hypothetical protein